MFNLFSCIRNMKKLSIYLSTFLCLIFIGFGCGSEDLSDYPPSNMRSIVRFTLNPAQNGGNVFVQHIATIDQSKKTITLKLPSHLDLKEIRPEIVAAPWTSVTPKSLEAVDFSAGLIEYTVVAESEKKAVYEVVLDMTYKYAACQLYSVAIPAVADPETGEPVKAVCNENNKTATLVVPANTDLTKLVPKFELSPESFNASFDKPDGKAYDFTEPVQFTVTSEDGKKTATYTVSVTTKQE